MIELKITIEIPDKVLEKAVSKYIKENIQSIAYKLDMKELAEMIRDECRPIIQQELEKIRKDKKWWKR